MMRAHRSGRERVSDPDLWSAKQQQRREAAIIDRMEKVVGESEAEWSFDPNNPIGETGGFGEVFRGRGPDGREVAIKRVRLRGSDAADRWREREVDIGRRIADARDMAKHLVAPLDIARSGTDLLIVMPLASSSLAAALKDDHLDLAAGRAALQEIAEGLMELAELGILHRDLKPHNVLRVDGRWKLADFGIARDLLESTATYTFRGAGTPPYMAPELWNNQSATAKTDLYAFGVLAYEVLTGHPPFDGSSEDDLRRQHLQAAPPSPNTGHSALDRLLLRLVAKDPAQRPQDARDVRDRLRDVSKALAAEQEGLQQAALLAQIRTTRAEAARRRELDWLRRFRPTPLVGEF